MKRIVSLCLGLCILLCGCTQQQETLFTGGEQTVETTAPLELTGYALYEWYCANVDEALQREMADYYGMFGGGIENYPRLLRVTANLLPADAPRLTLEQAEDIVRQALKDPVNSGDYYDVIKREFRKLAEADYDSCQTPRTVFVLDDSWDRYIELTQQGVNYHDAQARFSIRMCAFTKPEEFTSVAALIRQGKVPPVVPQSLEERCYSIATEEQKAELDSFRGPFEFGGRIIYYPRKMQQIVGLLPADAPRLTLEQAEEIIQEVLSDPTNYAEHYYVVKAALREIAEMDYDGGSGISHTYFCLNDAMTQYIDVSDFGVRYYDTQTDICIEMCWFYEPEEFTSVAALIRQGKVPPVVPQSLEERCYSIATEEQKAELDAFQGPFELKDIAVYPRKTQEIVGLLPADAPRLTLEQAEAILQKMLDEGDASYDRAWLAFREIAEVDYEGGSGLAFTHFCLNDAMTQSVVVHYSGVDYHDSQEGILIELVSFATEEFTSVLAMMEQGEIPPVRADSAE